MEAFVLRQYLRTSVKKNQVGEQWRVERCSRHIYSILSFIVEAEVLFLLVAKSLYMIPEDNIQPQHIEV